MTNSDATQPFSSQQNFQNTSVEQRSELNQLILIQMGANGMSHRKKAQTPSQFVVLDDFHFSTRDVSNNANNACNVALVTDDFDVSKQSVFDVHAQAPLQSHSTFSCHFVEEVSIRMSQVE